MVVIEVEPELLKKQTNIRIEEFFSQLKHYIKKESPKYI